MPWQWRVLLMDSTSKFQPIACNSSDMTAFQYKHGTKDQEKENVRCFPGWRQAVGSAIPIHRSSIPG